MAEILINPGSGPVDGDVTWENACANIKQYIKDSEIPLYIAKADFEPDDGRYLFALQNSECNLEFEVEMPGVPLDKVRYIDSEKQNIMDFPRLYVDGSSFVWKWAVITKAEVKEILNERIEEKKAEIENIKEFLLKIDGGENGN